MVIELFHETDPRYLVFPPWAELPLAITMDDLSVRRYGHLYMFPPDGIYLVYQQPEGHGTPWVKPVMIHR